MAERVSRRLVLLSSAAIGAVYLAGYMDTRSADASLASVAITATGATSTAAGQAIAAVPARPATQSTAVTTSTATTTAPTARPAAVAPTVTAVPPTVAAPPATATARPAPTAVPPTATAVPTGMRDGTYTGVGDSRRGAIQAAVTIKGGRIANVAITGSSTQYPVSWISQLPGEVIANQTYRIDLISGATYSSLAFEGAVRQALSLAQA